ncbi:MAG: hypothetical protein Q9200_000423 [Gallowayella weberi]
MSGTSKRDVFGGHNASTRRRTTTPAQPHRAVPQQQTLNPPSASLITFVKKRDEIPQNWMPSKKRRRSPGDTQQLGKFLEIKFGTSQPSGRRASSSIPAAANLKTSYPRWDAFGLPGHVKDLVEARTGKDTVWATAREVWRASFSLCRRQSFDRGIKLRAQDFHGHITGTFDRHISETTMVVQKLDDHGLLASPGEHSNGDFLTQLMAWLSSYRLVYLPVGIKPFQQNSIQIRESRAIDIMTAHLTRMEARLRVDIHHVLALQVSMKGHGQTAETIGHHIFQSKTEKDGRKLRKPKNVPFNSQCDMGSNIQGLPDYATWQNARNHGPLFDSAAVFFE